MQTKVSVRGQTVIPRPIREALGITSATRLQWAIKDGLIIVLPIPPDPVHSAVGVLKERGPSTADLLMERKAQRERET
ncbi:MAG: AbrB/MazE/SpoVT family DNA-binding domain-containing protein [Anaerolineae bacterium]|nr:AbrB/MazE/SpoVT family DNA-binding domain-containing protein [Anaerolineae bacterium]MDW8099007.1 AbrB/MazE/SpoVT family DNA-binding domain-containing protein [Anaerolineae bacterium]